MPLIIAATDFSDIAENAVEYACRLAADQGAQLLVLHSYMIPIMFSDVPMPASLVTDAQQDAEERMGQCISNYSVSFPGIGIKGKVIYGDFIDAIDDLASENPKPALVVLGNSTTDIHTSWPDNALIDALQKLNYPVLAVPPGTFYKPIQKICFAYDNEPMKNNNALEQITDFVRRSNAVLHVLNAQEDVHNQDNGPDFNHEAKSILDHVGAHYHMIFEINNVDAAIEDFVKNNQIDLLIILPRKLSFFGALFHRSHTKAVTRHSMIPILAIHDNHL